MDLQALSKSYSVAQEGVNDKKNRYMDILPCIQSFVMMCVMNLADFTFLSTTLVFKGVILNNSRS